MLVVTSVGGAYGLMLAGLVLLGTWCASAPPLPPDPSPALRAYKVTFLGSCSLDLIDV